MVSLMKAQENAILYLKRANTNLRADVVADIRTLLLKAQGPARETISLAEADEALYEASGLLDLVKGANAQLHEAIKAIDVANSVCEVVSIPYTTTLDLLIPDDFDDKWLEAVITEYYGR